MQQQDSLSPSTAVDPLPKLVESRFRLLTDCGAGNHQNDGAAIGNRMAQVRARRLDERIVTTGTISPERLLAQLRLLACFYEESLNGSRRRGALLIQKIAAGVEQLYS